MSLSRRKMPPLAGLSGKTSSKMAGFKRGSCENASITNDYQLKLKAFGLNSDPYNLPKNLWSMTRNRFAQHLYVLDFNAGEIN